MAFTNPITGSGFDDGFQVGIDEDGYGQVNQKEDFTMLLKTDNATRMKITRNSSDKTRVSITNGTNPWSPVAMLNIGDYQESGYVTAL